MKKTIDLHDFHEGFYVRDRTFTKGSVRDRTNFSYDGLLALFSYFEELEEDCGTEIEYDPIAICCEYTEYVSWSEFQEEYPDIEMEELRDNTQVIFVYGGGFIIRDF